MRNVSELFMDAALASHAPVISCDLFFNGVLVRSGLNLVGGTGLTSDMTRLVQDDVSLVFEDNESEGLPLSEQISALGHEILVRAGFDLAGQVELVNLGRFRVDEADAADSWQWYQDDAVRTGNVVTVVGTNLMSRVEEWRFFVSMQPIPGGDAWHEVQRICDGVIPVIDPGFPPRTIPGGESGLVYELSRTDALKDIADLWGARLVITPEGALTMALADAGDTAPKFAARVNLGKWRKKTTRDGVKNAVRVTGRDPEGRALVAYAIDEESKVRPAVFGLVPEYHNAEFLDTQSKVQAAANTYLQKVVSSRTQLVTVPALWNPAVEVGDYSKLVLPDGELDCRVISRTLPLRGMMTVTLQIPQWWTL